MAASTVQKWQIHMDILHLPARPFDSKLCSTLAIARGSMLAPASCMLYFAAESVRLGFLIG